MPDSPEHQAARRAIRHDMARQIRRLYQEPAMDQPRTTAQDPPTWVDLIGRR